ncbi:MAG: hypothetical protein GY953_35405 [bacterium]|nr:hypothetical protein [bacterium]
MGLPRTGQVGKSPPATIQGDDVETRLSRLWRDVFELPHAGVDEDFFDLGGNSVLAARLCARMAAEFGVDLHPAALAAGRTVRLLAALVRQPETLHRGCGVLAFHSQGARQPIFSIGAGVAFGELAGALGSDQPVYCLTPAAWAHIEPPFTIEKTPRSSSAS